ncbi:MAG: DMT family transporter [Rhizobacter sp.]
MPRVGRPAENERDSPGLGGPAHQGAAPRVGGPAAHRPMSWLVVAAVLCGALLHASWNALVKSSRDQPLDTALIHVLGCGVGPVLVLSFGLPRAAAWPWLATSLVIHVGYYITLVGAYRHGELGFAYPIMRGTAPLLVALASGSLIGERLGFTSWLGVGGISAGVLLIGLSRSGRAAGSRRHALAFALANATMIAAYTIVDGLGVRASGNAAQYVSLLFMLDGAPYFLILMWQRRRELAGAGAYIRRRWPVALLGACASLGSYGIALWAMTRAPVASVAALRETSVLFAALIGMLMLKEGFRIQRALGTLTIVAGVMALRLG